MSSIARRSLLMVAAALLTWYLSVLFLWALRPLEDHIPIGVDPVKHQAVSQTVACNTLFAGSPRPAVAMPGLRPLLPLTGQQFGYERNPCNLVQHDARLVFALNSLVLAVAGGGLVFVAIRLHRRGSAPPGSTLQRSAVAPAPA